MPDTAGIGELWFHASRVVERCSICISVVAFPPGWRVQIERRGRPEEEVHAENGHVVEALAEAVKLAEAKGLWGTP